MRRDSGAGVCGRPRRRGSSGMEPLLTDAARALATGDPLTALKRVALRDTIL